MPPERRGADRDRVRQRRRDRAPARAGAGGGARADEHGPDAARDRDLRGGAQHHDLRHARRGAALDRARRRRAARASAWSRATSGPGIEDVDLAMQDGYTSGGGLGLGLPGARRLVDEFDIETAPERGHDRHAGQVVEGALERRRLARRARGRRRGAGASRARSARATWRCSPPTTRGGLAAVIDGLGHGDDAADAVGDRRARDPRARVRPAGGAARSAATRRCARAAAWC